MTGTCGNFDERKSNPILLQVFADKDRLAQYSQDGLGSANVVIVDDAALFLLQQASQYFREEAIGQANT